MKNSHPVLDTIGQSDLDLENLTVESLGEFIFRIQVNHKVRTEDLFAIFANNNFRHIGIPFISDACNIARYKLESPRDPAIIEYTDEYGHKRVKWREGSYSKGVVSPIIDKIEEILVSIQKIPSTENSRPLYQKNPQTEL